MNYISRCATVVDEAGHSTGADEVDVAGGGVAAAVDVDHDVDDDNDDDNDDENDDDNDDSGARPSVSLNRRYGKGESPR